MSEPTMCGRIWRFVKVVIIWKLVLVSLIFAYRHRSGHATSMQNIDDESQFESNEFINNRNDDAWWERGSCNSGIRYSSNNNTSSVKGTCGRRSSDLGPGQRILSYCLYGNYTQYASGLPFILEDISVLYPGWILRLYTQPQLYKDQLCPLMEKYHQLHVCDVTSLPGKLGDISVLEPRMWRFSAIGDEQADVLMFRDLDAQIISREVDAVYDFLSRNETLHIMRDNPMHGVPVLAGTFGLRQTEINRQKLTSIRNLLFEMGPQKNNAGGYKTFDQTLLQYYLWPQLRSSSIAHDSYTCDKFPGSVPFPTRRKGDNFVGNRRYRTEYNNDRIRKKCPNYCRGSPDWEYC